MKNVAFHDILYLWFYYRPVDRELSRNCPVDPSRRQVGHHWDILYMHFASSFLYLKNINRKVHVLHGYLLGDVNFTNITCNSIIWFNLLFAVPQVSIASGDNKQQRNELNEAESHLHTAPS